MKNRFKSYGFWTALAGAVVVLLQALGECFGFSVDDEIISGVIMAIAGVLVVLGVVTMPKGEDNTESNKQPAESNEEEENSDDTKEEE